MTKAFGKKIRVIKLPILKAKQKTDLEVIFNQSPSGTSSCQATPGDFMRSAPNRSPEPWKVSRDHPGLSWFHTAGPPSWHSGPYKRNGVQHLPLFRGLLQLSDEILGVTTLEWTRRPLGKTPALLAFILLSQWDLGAAPTAGSREL